MNLSEYGKPFEGVVSGVYYGQYERAAEIDNRMEVRNVPDQPLPSNFDPRPVLTKYTLFPMLDNRMPATVPIQPIYNYSLENNFTPPVMATGPVSGFINNVHKESELRNQFFAHQKGADSAVYVPSSDSDLYKVYIPSTPSLQPYPLLFSTPTFNQGQHANLVNAPQIGKDVFHNNTRTQLR